MGLSRPIGLMILLEHRKSLFIFSQIRNYDVSLMVLISGISFRSLFKKYDSYSFNVRKEVKKLILFMWIFLSRYFHRLYVVDLQNNELDSLSLPKKSSYFSFLITKAL